MSGPSKVIVLDPDPRAASLLRLGFAREGVPAEIANLARIVIPEDPALAVVGGSDSQLLRRRGASSTTRARCPRLFAGTGVDRRTAEEAGADEIMVSPAYLRDVVTIGRILRGLPSGQRDHVVGASPRPPACSRSSAPSRRWGAARC